MRKSQSKCVLNDGLLMHGGVIPSKTKPLNDFYYLTDDLHWLKIFVLEGPKARCCHQMAAVGNTVYLLGGYNKPVANLKSKAEIDKIVMNDMWKFDFENA